MAELPDDIARINALTTNARNTWFALLGVLVFVGITLMGVEHIDFYGVDRATKLPLVDVEVPTRYFFIAAPILTAAIYGYFHLYLIRLWDALSDADAQYRGRPLGDVIAPWLVTDAALQLRRKWRNEDSPCNAHRTMETPAMVLNIVLAWLFGLVVLSLIWWQSMPARDLMITGIAALSLLASLVIGLASYVMLSRRMLRKRRGPPDLHRSVGFVAFLIFAAAFVLPLSWLRVTGIYTQNPRALATIAPIVMFNEEIVERPKDWLEYEFARKDYRARWCAREGIEDCSDFGEKEDDFTREWQSRRQSTLISLRRPDWHKNETKPDFRGADLRGTFLVGIELVQANLRGVSLNDVQLEGADLRAVQMQGVILENANLSGANLRWAQMQDTVLLNARMHSANLQGAQLQGAFLVRARLQRADLRSARLQNANLGGAQMQGVWLSGAKMQGADLRRAQMQGADLFEAELQGADLRWAKMQGAALRRTRMDGANFFEAQMQGADLRQAQVAQVNLRWTQMNGTDFGYSFLSGQPDNPFHAEKTDLSASRNHGGTLRNVDLRQAITDKDTDFRNAFLDGSVRYTDRFARQMGAGDPRPCQWVTIPVTSDQDFFALWRWWVEAEPRRHSLNDWRIFAPAEWRDVEPADAALRAKYGIPDDCEWKTGPMPVAEN